MLNNFYDKTGFGYYTTKLIYTTKLHSQNSNYGFLCQENASDISF